MRRKKKYIYIAGKILFISQNKLVFFRNVFLSNEIDWCFSEIGNNLMRAEQKKHMFFFGNALPKSNVRAHLKQRKKNIVALQNTTRNILYKYTPFIYNKEFVEQNIQLNYDSS